MKTFLILMAIALVLSVIPVTSLNSPKWDVFVVDQNGQPVSDMIVRLSYQNYSAESEGHELDAVSDERGHASFAPQTLRASAMRRGLSILQSAMGGVHASFGPHASVFAFGRGLQGYDVDRKSNALVFWRGTPDRMESLIVVEPKKL